MYGLMKVNGGLTKVLPPDLPSTEVDIVAVDMDSMAFTLKESDVWDPRAPSEDASALHPGLNMHRVATEPDIGTNAHHYLNAIPTLVMNSTIC